MKNKMIKRIACGMVAAAMVLTAAPVINAATSVTAEAKTKKEKKTKITFADGPFNKDKGIYVGKSTLTGYDFLVFSNMKAKAKYLIKTNSKNLSIKMQALKKKDHMSASWWAYNNDYLEYTINAKKAGTYKVTITEKYKGHTRTLKKNAKLYVTEPKAKESYTAYVGNKFDVSKLLSNYPGYGYFKYQIVEGGDSILSMDDDHSYYNPLADGNAKVKIFDENDKDCGTVNVTVKTNHCTGITLGDDDDEFEDDEESEEPGINMTLYSDPDDNSDLDLDGYYVIKGVADDDPDIEDNIPVVDKETITSADPSIASVKYKDEDDNDDDEGSSAGWYLTAHKVGDTTITVSCDGHTLDIPVHVKAESTDSEDEE